MLKASSHLKQQAVRSFGATVYEADDRSQAITLLDRLAQELPAVIVHPFNDQPVIAGQGTAVIELLGQVPISMPSSLRLAGMAYCPACA